MTVPSFLFIGLLCSLVAIGIFATCTLITYAVDCAVRRVVDVIAVRRARVVWPRAVVRGRWESALRRYW